MIEFRPCFDCVSFDYEKALHFHQEKPKYLQALFVYSKLMPYFFSPIAADSFLFSIQFCFFHFSFIMILSDQAKSESEVNGKVKAQI